MLRYRCIVYFVIYDERSLDWSLLIQFGIFVRKSVCGVMDTIGIILCILKIWATGRQNQVGFPLAKSTAVLTFRHRASCI